MTDIVQLLSEEGLLDAEPAQQVREAIASGKPMDDAVTGIAEYAEDDLDLSTAAQDASIIKFVNQVLAEALESRATDVHVEPFEDQLRVRYRIDGVLVEANIPPQVRKFHPAIV